MSISSRAVAASTALVWLMGFSTIANADPSEPLRWHGSQYSYGHSGSCNDDRRVDPIGVVFHGRTGHLKELGSFYGQRYVAGDIEQHIRWDLRATGEAQRYFSYGGCRPQGNQLGANDPVRPGTRYHIRLWEQPQQHVPGKYQTVGTPHHEDPCFNKEGVTAGPWRLPYGGKGTGFDLARRRLLQAYSGPKSARHHDARSVFWGNTQRMSQCRGTRRVGSNGYVNIITVGEK